MRVGRLVKAPSAVTVGHFRSSRSQERRAANGRFQGAAVIARRTFEVAHSLKRSPKVLPRWSGSDAGRMSAVRAAELELPIHSTRSRCGREQPPCTAAEVRSGSMVARPRPSSRSSGFCTNSTVQLSGHDTVVKYRLRTQRTSSRSWVVAEFDCRMVCRTTAMYSCGVRAARCARRVHRSWRKPRDLPVEAVLSDACRPALATPGWTLP
jgi:hypothetical protein